MRDLVLFSVLLVVILVVSSVGSAAPTKIEYRLTGGTQQVSSGPPFTPNGGPITTGRLTLSLFVDGCLTPPQPGSDACVRELYFRTSADQTYKVQDRSFLYPFASFTDARSSKMSLYAYETVFEPPTSPEFYWQVYVMRLRTQDHQLGSTDPLWSYGYHVHMGKSTTVRESYRALHNVQGYEVGYRVPASTHIGRLAIAVLLLATPALVIYLRHRAARANRRPS